MSRHKLWVHYDNYNRHVFLRNELKRILLKSIKASRGSNYLKRYLASYYLTQLTLKSANSKIVYRCVWSGRVWSVSRKAGISRFLFRKYAYNSLLPGCSKASW